MLEEPDLSETKYRLIEFLDAGGMGSVFICEDTELDRRVALKVLRLPDPSGELTDRLIREAKIVASLEHPGIVPVHDIGKLPDGRPYYVSKLVGGKRLDVFTAEEHTLPEVLRIFLRICEPVAFAHSRGVVHDDLKPQNIMVGEFGEVLILDWGAARQEGGGVSGQNVIGTHGFMSPEQEKGEPATGQSDVFSLGKTLAVMLTAHKDKLSRPLRAIIAKATAELPETRYGGIRDFARDISRYLEKQPISAYRENLLEVVLRWTANNRFIVMIVLVYVLVRLMIVLISNR